MNVQLHDLVEVANISLTRKHSESVWFLYSMYCGATRFKVYSSFLPRPGIPGMNLLMAADDVTMICNITLQFGLWWIDLFGKDLFAGNASLNA